MIVEPDPVFYLERVGFPDIVQEDAESQFFRWFIHQVEHYHGVHENIPLRMKFMRLSHSIHFHDLRQDVPEYPDLVHEFESTPRSGTCKNFEDLIPDAFRTDASDISHPRFYCLTGIFLYVEIQSGGEPDRPQETQVVLLEALIGITDCPDEPRFDV